MVANVDQKTGGNSDDRLVGDMDTPVSPILAPPPLTQAAPEIFVPTEQQRLLHEADKLQQERVAALLHHVAGFRNGPEDENWDIDAYEKLTQIPGVALAPLAEMMQHGAAIRSQLEFFRAAQSDLEARLTAMTKERDTLRMSALVDERVKIVSAARTRNPVTLRGFGLQTPAHSSATPGSGASTSAHSATSATSRAPVASVMIQGQTKHLNDPPHPQHDPSVQNVGHVGGARGAIRRPERADSAKYPENDLWQIQALRRAAWLLRGVPRRSSRRCR
jgi:hypothetical protein